jgi:hypothetical protein
MADREGIVRLVMKAFSNRRTVGLSAGRVVALLLGISAPLAFWSFS